MAVSKAQQEAVARYNAKSYDRIELKVKKGRKDIVKTHAESQGESLNGFINRAIDETMKRDNDDTDIAAE